MHVDITVVKTQHLPEGALAALSSNSSGAFPVISPMMITMSNVRDAGDNQLSVLGGCKVSRDHISNILQETWESADNWFITD